MLLCSAAVGCGSVRGGHFCGSDDVGSLAGTGQPAVPDGSFDDEPSLWTLPDYATIDSSTSCDLEHSLRLQLDQGLGPAETVRSANLEAIEAGKEYTFSFFYRYDHCKSARWVFTTGNWEVDVKSDGGSTTWVQSSLDVTFATVPVSIEIRPTRVGNEADFTGSDYDNNVLWVDDMRIDPKQ